jgi:hypothetical protein
MMNRLVKEKRGMFVIVAALIIAALTLTTAIAIHEINIHRQSITYRPADGFLLGTTSDMNRILTVSLANYTDGILNQDLTETEADTAASQSLTTWKESMLTSYASYGITMDEPLLPTWSCNWNGTTAYSLSSVQYDLDVDSYGFKGWMGRSYKYVQLQIFPESITEGSGTTSFNFTLKESLINEEVTVPILGFSQHPGLDELRVGTYDPSQPFIPASQVSLEYLGDGNYSVTFDQPVDNKTLGVRIDLATPNDNIWISANNYEHLRDWSSIHLISGEILQPNYLYTPDKSSFSTPTLNTGNPFADFASLSENPTSEIVCARVINMTFYLASLPPKAERTLTVELGFTYDSTYYQIGNSTIDIVGSASPVPHSVSIDVENNVFVSGFGARTIPEGSLIQLTLSVSFEEQAGSGKVFLDGNTPSQINLY